MTDNATVGKNGEAKTERREKRITGRNGVTALILLILLTLSSWVGFCLSVFGSYRGLPAIVAGGGMVIFGVLGFAILPLCFAGLKAINPNEALVLTLFGQYYGTLREEGFFWVHPFCVGINPAASAAARPQVKASSGSFGMADLGESGRVGANIRGKKISLKALTLNNEKQKVNDELGNPIEIGVNVIWQVRDTAKAVFQVDNYLEFLSIQCDSALRDIARSYPYDVSDLGDERSLRGSSQEVAEQLKAELQEKVEVAGIEVLEARITHLAYAPEIAAAMLQRQQAAAVIQARQMIVDGAVSMVEMALKKLSEREIVVLDDERRAAMVSNLLVILCGSKEAQPIVNSGSLY
ncbi:MAG: SPFH domain-containing protein [Peptococcaceae bacterium]|nr:SPFH domain-containing protein [Peptococcaceae bacterium]